jgi:hypothetical protein
MTISSTARPRRTISLLAAAALAVAGLALAPAANAAADPSLTVSPSPATPNTVQTFTATVEGGSTNNIAAANVTLPAAFSGISNVTLTSAPTGWSFTYASATRLVQLTNPTGAQASKLGSGQTATFTFQALTPAATGSVSFSLQTWSNHDRNGSGITTTSAVSVGSLTQTIAFDALADKTYGDAPFTVSATGGGSNNAVTFTASGNCTAGSTNGATITITGAGSCTVTAHQAAGNGYTAAPDVEQSFDIAKADQTVSINPIAAQTYSSGATVDVAATASSGLAVDLGVSSGPCTVDGSTLTLTGAGVCTITGDQAGNANYNAATQVSSSFTINKGAATLELTTGVFDYDGDAHAASASTTPAGLSGVTITYDGSTSAPTDAGSYTVVASLTNNDYQATQQTGTLVINPKHLTGAFTVAGKTYDGNTDAAVATCTLPDGVVGGDDVSLDCSHATASFSSKDAGDRSASLAGAVLAGTEAHNYVLDGTGTASATISPKRVTGAIQASDKTYNGNTDASAVGLALAGKVGSDDVTVDVVSASFVDKNVGVAKTVTATIQLAGGAAGNYELTSATATDTATIWAKQLVGSFTADDKVYNGTMGATVHPNELPGVIGSEDVTLSVTGASFGDKNVGTDKTVTATLALTGAGAGNYELASSSINTALADITVRSVAGSFTAANKAWDNSNAATISDRSLAPASGDTGKIAGDAVALWGGTASFDTAAVGTGKTVTGSGFSLTGIDAVNYALTPAQPWTTTASIYEWYTTKGFYAPVDMTPAGGAPVYNTIKGGQTVPLKFEVFAASTGLEQTSVGFFGDTASAQAAAFKISPVSCNASASIDAVEVTTTGGTSFRYDTTGGQFIQNWKTPTNVGSCYAVSVTATDGTTVGPAYFKITK